MLDNYILMTNKVHRDVIGGATGHIGGEVIESCCVCIRVMALPYYLSNYYVF